MQVEESPGFQLIAKKKIEHYSYALNEQIGKGFSSKVFMGKNEKTGEVVAVKVIDRKGITNDVERGLLHQEIDALKIMHSPNILRMFDYYHTSNNTYLITEYCNQGDLEGLIKKCGTIPEIEAAKILKHITNGFKEQIRKGVIHRDLKPANIFLKNGIPKIADFGFSKMMNAPKEKVYYNVGTPLYMSPQTIIHNRYSEKSDMWSIGVLYYEVLYGQVPWSAPTEQELVQMIQKQPPFFDPRIQVSEESKDFLRRALAIDEDQRLSVKDLDSHPLFQRRNTTQLSRPNTNLLGSYNSSQSVERQPQVKPLTLSPERRITAYARTGDSYQDPARATLKLNQVSKDTPKQSSPIWIPGQLEKLNNINNGNQKGDLETAQSDSHHKPNKSTQIQKLLVPSVQQLVPSGQRTHQSNQQPLQQRKSSQHMDNMIRPTIPYVSTTIKKNIGNQSREAIITQLNICKFLFRTARIIEHYDFFQSPNLKDCIYYLILKNIMIVIQRLKETMDKGTDQLKLDYSQEQVQNIYEFKQAIAEAHKIYQECFQKQHDKMNGQSQFKDLQSDIDDVFYATVQNQNQKAIKELEQRMKIWLEASTQEELSSDVQAGVILLDFLVVYQSLIKLMIESLHNPSILGRSIYLENLANGKPGKIDRKQFQDIRKKISELNI